MPARDGHIFTMAIWTPEDGNERIFQAGRRAEPRAIQLYSGTAAFIAQACW